MRPVRFHTGLGARDLPPLPAAAQDQPNAAPPKPYKTGGDRAAEADRPIPAFDALRKQLAEADRAQGSRGAGAVWWCTLGFFWDRENGNGADQAQVRRRRSRGRARPQQRGRRRLGHCWRPLPTTRPRRRRRDHKRHHLLAGRSRPTTARTWTPLIDATDTDPTRLGLPGVARGRGARRRRRRRAGDRQARPLFRAHDAGTASPPRPPTFTSPCRAARPAMSRSTPSRRWATTSSATCTDGRRLEDRRLCRRRRAAMTHCQSAP